MENENIFDIYFVNQYGTTADQIKELANNFDAEDVYDVLIKAKNNDYKELINKHSLFKWEDLTSFERSLIILIITELRNSFAEDKNFDTKLYEELFFDESKILYFIPYAFSSLALLIQKDIGEVYLNEIADICKKAGIQVIRDELKNIEYE
ncbi:hypothetical protein [Bacillus pseudomycoides]|uniref:hypothetical protein n=1 Tax=Bacillus pseudomycoides TaxID=64104 RepID=UPI0005035EE5|nr:hypothetical protein [Bacillus pseudomycoides]KFN11946.1 hypothetical protein DJ94_5320 [Bacillus pseudomycoides]MDR4188097.1 hypothetical protein [Bacillus pseudomycoides]MED0855811.1 hypothetical protein [Bacillus pseudomycoides]PFX43512.1 hypothetical protein COL32_14350 [Bacillus pseudomycoides]PGA76476.1 hypothetical protein COL87_01260 [Bacillus pseudomycoides]